MTGVLEKGKYYFSFLKAYLCMCEIGQVGTHAQIILFYSKRIYSTLKVKCSDATLQGSSMSERFVHTFALLVFGLVFHDNKFVACYISCKKSSLYTPFSFIYIYVGVL